MTQKIKNSFLKIRNLFVFTLLLILTIGLLPFSIPLLHIFIRFCITASNFIPQLNSLSLPDKTDEKGRLIDEKSENITLVFLGRNMNIDKTKMKFHQKWVDENIFPRGIKVVLLSYNDFPVFWTQRKIERWIARKIEEVEKKHHGKIVNVYGTCIGGYFATESYRQLQRKMSKERKQELAQSGYNKLIVDRSFADLTPMFGHFCSISEKSASYVTKMLNCGFVNPLFSQDSVVQREMRENIDMKNVTFIESDQKDKVTPPCLQAGVAARNQGMKARYFLIDNERHVHTTAFGNKGTSLTEIDENGKKKDWQ